MALDPELKKLRRLTDKALNKRPKSSAKAEQQAETEKSDGLDMDAKDRRQAASSE